MKSRFNARKLFLVGLLCAGYGTTVQGQVFDFAVTDTAPLLRFGPTSPVNGYPLWVEAVDTRAGALPGDTILLELCHDTTDVTPPLTTIPGHLGVAPPCAACVDPLLDLPIPGQPQVFPTNYPDEHFYWLTESLMKEVATDNTVSIVVMALEAAFDGLGAVVDGEQLVFTRYRIRVDNATPGELYQITYPYGLTYAEAENDQAGAAVSNINFTNDIFLWKGVELRNPLSSMMGSFLTALNPPPAPGVTPEIDPLTGAPIGPPNLFSYLADFCGGGPIEGSPFGTNFFSVVGPDAGMIQSSLNSGSPLTSENQCDPTTQEMIDAFDAYDAYVRANLDPTYAGLAKLPRNCTFSDEFVGIAKEATTLGVEIDRASYNRSLTAGSNSTQINVWASSFKGQDIRLTIPGIVGDIPMCGDGTGNYFAHVLMPSNFIPPAEVTAANFTDNPPSTFSHPLSANIVIDSAIADLGANAGAGALTITATIADPAQSASLSTGGSSLILGTASLALAGGTCGAVPPRSVSVASTQGGFVTAPTQVIGVVPELLAAAGGTVVVAIGTTGVLLDGTATVAGPSATYSWSQTGGTSVILSDPTAVSPTFSFPASNDLLTFELTVTDTVTGATSTDTATVTNTVVAVAGADQDLTSFPDLGVALDASATQGSGLSYSWAQIATDVINAPQCAGLTLDAAASIDLPNSAAATLVMPLSGGCVTLELTVIGVGGTSSDTVTIKAPVGAPVANAGADLVVFAGELVQLDASASVGIIDAGGFAWTQTAGEIVALGSLGAGGVLNIDPLGAPTISMPAFNFPTMPQTLTFQVVVSGPGGTSSDTVDVIVSDPGTSDTVTIDRAFYDNSKERFRVDGKSSVPGPGHSVTCWFGSPTTGDLIGTAAVDALADWGIDAIGVLNPCAVDPNMAIDCDTGTPSIPVQCISTLGGTEAMIYEARK